MTFICFECLRVNANGLKLTTTTTTTVASLFLGAWQKFFFWCEKHACTVAQLNVKRGRVGVAVGVVACIMQPMQLL